MIPLMSVWDLKLSKLNQKEFLLNVHLFLLPLGIRGT